MIEKNIKFRGLDGEIHTETWYFNMTEVEATRLETSVEGGLLNFIENMGEDTPDAEILDLFENLIQLSVGTLSEDGTRFVKTDEILADFLASPAYSALFSELASEEDKASAFFNGVLSRTYIEPKKPKQS